LARAIAVAQIHLVGVCGGGGRGVRRGVRRGVSSRHTGHLGKSRPGAEERSGRGKAYIVHLTGLRVEVSCLLSKYHPKGHRVHECGQHSQQFLGLVQRLLP
jgi:hypothetical protein